MAGINLFYIINRTVKGSKMLYIKFVGHDGEVLTTTSATSLAHKLGYPKTDKITRKKKRQEWLRPSWKEELSRLIGRIILS